MKRTVFQTCTGNTSGLDFLHAVLCILRKGKLSKIYPFGIGRIHRYDDSRIIWHGKLETIKLLTGQICRDTGSNVYSSLLHKLYSFLVAVGYDVLILHSRFCSKVLKIVYCNAGRSGFRYILKRSITFKNHHFNGTYRLNFLSLFL